MPRSKSPQNLVTTSPKRDHEPEVADLRIYVMEKIRDTNGISE